MGFLLSVLAVSKNQVHISDQMLLSGGQEMVLIGDPKVITDNNKGQIFSEITYLFRFADNSQRMHHVNNVRYESNHGFIFSGREMVEHIDKRVHQMIFIEELVFHESSENESISTIFQCQSNNLVKNGQTMQINKISLVKGISVYCDANDNPVLNLIEFVIVPR